MKMTSRGTKKFTKKEKLSIIKEAGRNGVKVTLEKYDLYPATYYYWKRKINEQGEIGLDHGMTKAKNKQIKTLEKEVLDLKILLAERDLEIKLQQDMIKKKYPNLR